MRGNDGREPAHALKQGKLAEELAELFEPACEEAEQSFRSQIAKHLMVLGDRDLIGQALSNLLDNAIQSSNGEAPIDVTLSGTLTHVDLSVSDRGAGWPTIVKNHQGEPFVTTKEHGVGLGLYFVHSLTEAIGAELHLEDRESGGATARISFPRTGIADLMQEEDYVASS